MAGPQALLVLLVVLAILNLPVLAFGFLATKCGLYVFPRVKRFFLIRWALPCVIGFSLFLFGIGTVLAHLERPWPTSPYLSGWGCLGLLCLADGILLVMWPYLKYRDYSGKKAVHGTSAERVANTPQPQSKSPLGGSGWTGW